MALTPLLDNPLLIIVVQISATKMETAATGNVNARQVFTFLRVFMCKKALLLVLLLSTPTVYKLHLYLILKWEVFLLLSLFS